MSEIDSTPTNKVHHVAKGVHIKEGTVQIECDCGWTTKKYESEGDARQEFDAHQEEINGRT